ncbi:MAG: tetratricopeptide repeat protein [Crocosphaera sp.]
MSLETPLKLSKKNNLNYQKLLSLIEASENTLSILIAVCDDRKLQNKIIEAYEKELLPNISGYKTRLDQNEPSLRAAIYKIFQSEDFKRNKKYTLLTITGAEDLFFIRNNGEKSQQDKFFGYLQWTREGLREFPYPIVVWVTNQILVNLSRKAPDFWSWRKGVFHFIPEPSLTLVLPSETDDRVIFYDHLKENYSDSLSLEDLEELITSTEKKRGKNDPNLVTLYNRLGDIYFNRIRSGEAVNFPDEKERALLCYSQALDISRNIGDRQGEGDSLGNLGSVYQFLGQYQQAITYYEKALEIFREIGDRFGEGMALTDLGSAYRSVGKYQKAIFYHQQSLEISREIEDKLHERNTLGNLGNVYCSLGRYQEAITYHQQSLEISRETEDKFGEEKSVANLGNVYFYLGRYQEAITYYQRSLEMLKEIGDKSGERVNLLNLGNVYGSLGQYQEAIAYYKRSLDISREMGDRRVEASSLIGLGNVYCSVEQYQQAIRYYQQSLAIKKEIGDRNGEATSYNNLGVGYSSFGQDEKAIQYYHQSLAIKREIGDKRGEANALFNLGLSFKNVQLNQEAKESFSNARQLYKDMALKQMIERCDNEINSLVSRD